MSKRFLLVASFASLLAGWALLVADSPAPPCEGPDCNKPQTDDVGLAGDATLTFATDSSGADGQ